MTTTTNKPNWMREHGAGYAVPGIIANADGIADISWKNDMSPTFTTQREIDDLNKRKGGYPRIIIWVDHPEPSERELESINRFTVYLIPVALDDYDGLGGDDGRETLYDGNIAADAMAAFREGEARLVALDSKAIPPSEYDTIEFRHDGGTARAVTVRDLRETLARLPDDATMFVGVCDDELNLAGGIFTEALAIIPKVEDDGSTTVQLTAWADLLDDDGKPREF